MKELYQKWNSISLVKRIIGGLVIGSLLGVTVPGLTSVAMLGSIFTGALKGIAPILVFFLVISALANHKPGSKSNMGLVVGLYLVETLLAAFIAAIACFVFPVTLTLGSAVDSITPPGGVGEVIENLLLNLVANPVTALSSANYIGILAWAVMFGLALKSSTSGTKELFGNIADAVSSVVRFIISFAPFGVLGLVFETVSTSGISIFADYGKLLLLLVGVMLVVGLVLDPLMAYLTFGENPYPLVFKLIRESFITAFFTRSSAANIPVNMEVCERLGLDEDAYSVSIPLGATINMSGAAITITVMTLAAVHTLGIEVNIVTAVILSFLATVSACGASGVAGGSLLLIPLACSLFGIPNDVAMQVVGVGFIIGVVQDSFETGLNSYTDVLFTASAEFRQWKKAGKKIEF